MTIKAVAEEYADDVGFAWFMRDRAAKGLDHALKHLAQLDERVEADIDGLRIAAEMGWQLCRERLSSEEAGDVFAAAVLAFESGREERIREVLEAGTESLELSRGVISAVGWLSYEKAKPHIQKLLDANDPILRRIGLAASAIHGKHLGQALEEAIGDSNVLVRARALRAAGELGRMNLLPVLRTHFTDEDETCRFWAAWSAALLGDRSGISVLRDIAERGGALSERSADIAARRMKLTDALAWQKNLAADADRLRLAVKTSGAIGDPALMRWIIEMMASYQLARVAGEAFAMITGVDIRAAGFEGEPPEEIEAASGDESEDEDMETDPDDHLPWPHPERIERWWADNQSQFPAGTRHLAAKPITFDDLQEVLRTGKQRHRAAAALEIALLRPGRFLFEVRARGDRQQQILGP